MRKKQEAALGLLILIVGGSALVLGALYFTATAIAQSVSGEALVFISFFLILSLIWAYKKYQKLLSQQAEFGQDKFNRLVSEYKNRLDEITESHAEEISLLKKQKEERKISTIEKKKYEEMIEAEQKNAEQYKLDCHYSKKDLQIKNEQLELIQNRYNELLEKYKPVSDVQAEVDKLNEEKRHLEVEIPELQVIKNELDLVHIGFYNFRYNFDDSEKYKLQLKDLKEIELEILKESDPLVWNKGMNVFGLSEKNNERMAKRISKLAVMAFYGEFDSLLAGVKYNNVEDYVQKIDKIARSIETLLKDYSVNFRIKFLDIKKDELCLVHEYQEILYKEKEEQRLIKEQMREEEKALREAQKAQEEAEREEKNYQRALDRAREELEKNKTEDQSLYLMKIQELETKLTEAQAQKERAKSQAELTKQGHVYIISNIGSFGENVYKIGMTRRLEPMDRVKELGDASVPFEFDVHALVFCEDAPALERRLHSHFHSKRVNLINEKKEFFRVSLDEIELACKQHCKNELKLTKVAEAKDYNMTLAKLKEMI